jgi:hypothetical protein
MLRLAFRRWHAETDSQPDNLALNASQHEDRQAFGLISMNQHYSRRQICAATQKSCLSIDKQRFLADRQGFEPWVRFHAHTLSKRAP